MKKINLKRNLTTGYDMQFLSGVCYSLPTTKGFFIADSACGDGKTTMITEITKQMLHSGILIVVQTTEAADEIFDRLCKLISKEHICLLHSQPKAEKYMVEHRENPTALWNYPVLIITAVRLQQYSTDLFIKFGVLGNKFREYVMIDEIISFFPASPIDPNRLLPDITFISGTKDSKRGRLIKKIKVDGKTVYQYLYKDYKLMIAGVKANPKQNKHFKNALAKYRLQDILRCILSSGDLRLPLLDVNILAANSNVILFDGTADVMFPGDSRLLSSGAKIPKYSSDITFKQFHLPFWRRNNCDWDIGNLELLGDNLFKWIVTLTQTEKVLIVTWKDIDRKVKKGVSTDKLEEKETFDFPDILSKLLDERGAVKDNYGIIYRGSGLERGCNTYKDFETIIFLGEWFISDDITLTLNDVFKAKSTMKDYKKSLLIQSICRLKIRQHTGDPIKVYFSDDMNYNLIYEVQEYFKANSTPGCKIDGVVKPLPRLDRHEKNHLFDISILSTAFPKLINSLISNTSLTIDIPKSDLFRYLPKDRNSVDRYKCLMNYLKSRGITINIT